MDTDLQRRLRHKSDELLAEADRLEAIERAVDSLPVGSEEIAQVAKDAVGGAARLHRVAREDEALTRRVAGAESGEGAGEAAADPGREAPKP